MRKLLIRSLISLVCLGILATAWSIAGRHFTLVLDSFATAAINSLPITAVSYEDGVFRIGEIMLGTTGPNNRPFPIEIRTDKQDSSIVADHGKTFRFGRTREPNGSATREFMPDPGDNVVLTIRRSALAWPTPFDFNFMTGHSPSWRRYRYYCLSWAKKSGPKLKMVWRYQQYFYSGDGWTGGLMTYEASDGLLKVDIEQ